MEGDEDEDEEKSFLLTIELNPSHTEEEEENLSSCSVVCLKVCALYISFFSFQVVDSGKKRNKIHLSK